MTPIAQALSAALLHFVWQGLLVAFTLWIALFLLKRRSANARYLASSAALAALALLPVITTVLLYRRPTPASESIGFVASAFTSAAGLSHSTAPRFAWLPFVQAWALPLWSAGVFVFSIRLAWGCRQVAVLRRAGEAPSTAISAMATALRSRLGIRRPVNIIMTAGSDSPSVVGWLRPAILLPAATLLGLTEQQLEAVLAHEFAHIRRHDYFVNLLQNLVETLLFYHPAVWWTSARMRHERELCCDDIAVQSCGDALSYARALTTLEKMRLTAPALALASTGGALLYRIQRLMGIEARETAPSRVPAVAAVLMGLACLALNMNWARAQEQERGQVSIRAGVPGELGMAVTMKMSDGPGVQVELGGQQIASRPGIEYPEPAWKQKIGGTVVAEAVLAADGSVTDARILSGPAELRRSVLQSLLEWRFAPAPAGALRQVSVNFQWEQAQQKTEGRVFWFNNRTVTIRPSADNSSENAELATNRLRDELKAARQSGDQPKIRELEEKLSHAEAGVTYINGWAEGRVVSRIAYSGLTEQQQNQIAGVVPVRLGDTLTHEKMESVSDALNKVDPKLGHSFSLGEGNRVEIKIFPVRGWQFLKR
jgi:TonB family protein